MNTQDYPGGEDDSYWKVWFGISTMNYVGEVALLVLPVPTLAP